MIRHVKKGCRSVRRKCRSGESRGSQCRIPTDSPDTTTGYLVGTVDRFCDAKRKELGDRVVHMGANFGKPSKF